MYAYWGKLLILYVLLIVGVIVTKVGGVQQMISGFIGWAILTYFIAHRRFSDPKMPPLSRK